jgi:hypothetical protein
MFMGELCPNRKLCDRKWAKFAKYRFKYHQNNSAVPHSATDTKVY